MPSHDPIIDYIGKGVYHPSDDSYLLLDYLKKNITEQSFDKKPIEKIKNILEMGTGSGIIAIYLALIKKQNPNFSANIFASDIFSKAIESAKKNAHLNKVNEEIEFIESNLFNSFPNKLKNLFDIIIFNPPYLSSLDSVSNVNNTNMQDYSWDGGNLGYELFLKFIVKAKEYLRFQERSLIYFICSDSINLKEFYKLIQKEGFKITFLDKKHFFFEDIILNRLEPIKS